MHDERRTFSFLSADRIHTIQAVTWYPTEMPCKGIIQVSHGMTEHFARYEDFAHAMTAQGFAVSGHDHLGHKTSVNSDYELGFFAHEDGWKMLVADLLTHTKKLKEAYPQLPIFLLGHSMGSFVARCYIAGYSKFLDGAILEGTGGPNPAAKSGRLLANVICRTRGDKSHSALLQKLVFGNYLRGITPRTPYDWISRSHDFIDSYAADPYCTFQFTVGAFQDLFSLVINANCPAAIRKVPKEFPLLFLSGEEDPVGSYGEGPRKVAELFRQTGHIDVTLKLYPGARHDLLHETNRAEVIEALSRWLLRRV